MRKRKIPTPATYVETPYGLWPSPITPAMLAGGKRLNDLQWVPGSDMLLWHESANGKSSIYAKPAGQAPYNLTEDKQPSGACGYGGGEFTAARSGLYFSDKDGRVYFKTYTAGTAKALTPAFGGTASPTPSPDEKFLVYVHTVDDKDVLALLELGKEAWPSILVSGADFYMQPAWSPDGSKLAWVEWNHPNMPWEGSLLKLADFDRVSRSLKNIHIIDGDEHTAIFQPTFAPNGIHLAYMASRLKKDEITLLHIISGQKASYSNNHNFLPAAWVQGMRTMHWNPSSQAIYFIDQHEGKTRLARLDVSTHKAEFLPDDGFTVHKQLTLSEQGTLAYIGESASLPARAVVAGARHQEIIARSQSDSIEPAYLSKPESFSWNSSDGVQVFGIYYAPQNPGQLPDGAPPLICHIHGGPTSQVSLDFNMEANYFTSRGYAYFAVNYRGSTGYGRAYREALDGRWGELDVQDTVEGCQALIGKGKADPKKLIIMGGSAGGYTVYNALIHHPGFFKAGICKYGVANLFQLDMDTHKFEAHYNHGLVGALPEAAQKYHDFSPAFHANKIQDSLAIFQGSADKIVPLNQAEEMVAQLRRNGINLAYKVYEGEGHGFRKTENIIDYYETVDRFLKQNVIFSAS